MTVKERTTFKRAAAVAAMQAIVSNPIAWAELKIEAACNKLTVTQGLAGAACNLAEAVLDEVEQRELTETKAGGKDA